MKRNKPIDRILSNAEQIARVWEDNPPFSLGDLTLTQFEAMLTDLRSSHGKVEDLRTQLTAAINDSNSKAVNVNDAVTRARSGFRAMYGPDSTQYEQAGGTRRSDRKRPVRKPKTS
jgi:hypothetical protein